jgi:glycosyltransferase involved in cell wall biosynthesis
MASICIVAHFAFGAMAGGDRGHTGGVERQTSIMARWLAARGHHVSFITWDEGQEEDSLIEGVRLIKLCRQEDGLLGLRFFHPRWTSLNRALRKADANLYYQNCAECITGQVALWCRRRGRRFVYSVASDPDCDPGLPELKTLRERVLYRYGLKAADRIIVQTKKQQKMLFQGFGLGSIILPMPCPGPSEDQFQKLTRNGNRPFRVAWAGRIVRVKRLEFLLDVAERVPAVSFQVAGKANADDRYAARLTSRMNALPNVAFLGAVPRNLMSELYEGSSVFCCTSAFEGFPNTFLEAWSYGLPIVSTVDPDQLIENRELGFKIDTPADFAECIQTLKEDPTTWKKMSTNARRYYRENHSIGPAMQRFEEFFSDVSAGAQRIEP